MTVKYLGVSCPVEVPATVRTKGGNKVKVRGGDATGKVLPVERGGVLFAQGLIENRVH